MWPVEWFLIYSALGLSTVVNIVVPVSGSAVVTPLLALLTDPYRAIGIASFFFFLSAITRSFVFREYIQWNEVKFLLFPSVVAALVGAFALVVVPEAALLVVILLFSLFFLLRKLGLVPHAAHKTSRLFEPFVGVFSGFLQGTGLAGSDLRNQYLYAQGLNLQKVHGTTAFIGAANFLVATVVRVYTNQLSLPDVAQLLYLFPLIIVATLVGKYALLKLSAKVSNCVVIFVMIAVVVSLGYKILF